MAYSVSGAGLERGGTTEASFLVLRARSLPEYQEERRAVCAAAAAQIARQQRNMEVVEAAVELIADTSYTDLPLTAEQASTVVRKEKAARAFPTAYSPGPNYSDLTRAGSCNCPKCRARGAAAGPFEDFEEDDDDVDLDAILGGMELPPDMPPEVAKVLFEETRKAVERGESLDSLLNRVFGPGAGFGGRRKKGRRR